MTEEELDLTDWLNDPARGSGFDLVTGRSAARSAGLDAVMDDARSRGLPVVRLDGNDSAQWAAQLHLQLGPLSLSLDVRTGDGPRATSPGAAPTGTPSTGTAPTSAPTTPTTPTAPTGPASAGPSKPLESSIDELARLAVANGGAVLAIDNLHKVPAAVRDALFRAVENSSAPILVVGSTTPSHAARLDRAGTILDGHTPSVTPAPASHARAAALGATAVPEAGLARPA